MAAPPDISIQRVPISAAKLFQSDLRLGGVTGGGIEHDGPLGRDKGGAAQGFAGSRGGLGWGGRGHRGSFIMIGVARRAGFFDGCWYDR